MYVCAHTQVFMYAHTRTQTDRYLYTDSGYIYMHIHLHARTRTYMPHNRCVLIAATHTVSRSPPHTHTQPHPCTHTHTNTRTAQEMQVIRPATATFQQHPLCSLPINPPLPSTAVTAEVSSSSERGEGVGVRAGHSSWHSEDLGPLSMPPPSSPSGAAGTAKVSTDTNIQPLVSR